MRSSRLAAVLAPAAALALSACGMGGFGGGPPPAMPRPAAFTALGLSAAYLNSDVIGGRKSRAAKMRAAKIRPLTPSEAPVTMQHLEQQLRTQTAGIGVDVLNMPDGLLIRIPSSFTFESNSSAIRPEFDATLLELSRTLKLFKATYVDVLAHTDTVGSAEYNLNLSQKRAAAVAAFLAGHGVARARIASKGLGESAPLFNPDVSDTQQAANRRVELRVVAFR
ncbi:outer membrane protein OmpA-like peptidoglycan-associated protein [Sphingomonas sp. F9_3S_D5_B_2]